MPSLFGRQPGQTGDDAPFIAAVVDDADGGGLDAGDGGAKNQPAVGLIRQLLALVPDFEQRGRSLIRRFAYLDEHVDMLVDGVRKAGLEIQSEG